MCVLRRLHSRRSNLFLSNDRNFIAVAAAKHATKDRLQTLESVLMIMPPRDISEPNHSAQKSSPVSLREIEPSELPWDRVHLGQWTVFGASNEHPCSA
jgi:hypothetical protein